MTTPTQAESLRQEVGAFLSREARLLDTHDYESWLELWTDEARYWVPSERADSDPRHEVSIIYDDRDQLADRVFRLTHPASHAFKVRPQVVRAISNVEIEAASGDSLIVHSVYVLVANRHDRQVVFAARVRHSLVHVDDGFKIQSKTVVPTTTGDAMRNLTFLP